MSTDVVVAVEEVVVLEEVVDVVVLDVDDVVAASVVVVAIVVVVGIVVVAIVVVVGAMLREPAVTGDDCADVPPLPNWPAMPSPQHFTAPVASAAHECFAPSAISTTPDDNPTTACGVCVDVALPLPS